LWALLTGNPMSSANK